LILEACWGGLTGLDSVSIHEQFSADQSNIFELGRLQKCISGGFKKFLLPILGAMTYLRACQFPGSPNEAPMHFRRVVLGEIKAGVQDVKSLLHYFIALPAPIKHIMDSMHRLVLSMNTRTTRL
jgi:hypothetical protein